MFSYRFAQNSSEIFDKNFTWRKYKEKSLDLAKSAGTAAVIIQTDISSFYDHVSHHYIENLINELHGDAENVSTDITHILGKISSGRSFGLPVGGQCARILSELFLNQIDKLLVNNDIKFLRYVDDFILISEDVASAYKALGNLSHFLMNYGLTLNKTKTIILNSKYYNDYVKAQLGKDENDLNILKKIDLKFDPYSDNPISDFDNLKETINTLDIRKLLNNELEKSIPDNFLITQISRTLQLQNPKMALEIIEVFLSKNNLHAFRSSFSTIMRGISYIRSQSEFEIIHNDIDVLLDKVPIHSSHLLTVETSLLHFLRCLRFSTNNFRETYINNIYHNTEIHLIKRSCIECWRFWKDSTYFNLLRNKFDSLALDNKRLFWLMTFKFGDQGKAARRQFKSNFINSIGLGIEIGVGSVSRELNTFANIYIEWVETLDEHL